VKNQKAAYIGCPNCGSKLNKERLRSEYCPLCNGDLRAVSTLERIESYKKRIADYEAKIKEERLKRKNKAEIKWLVKFEYHS
jgi:transcription initiation factor IIE alpha subunit